MDFAVFFLRSHHRGVVFLVVFKQVFKQVVSLTWFLFEEMFDFWPYKEKAFYCDNFVDF